MQSRFCRKHFTCSEKNIADSAAGDSAGTEKSLYAKGQLVKTFTDSAIYGLCLFGSLFLLNADSNDVLISALELKLEK